MQILLQKKKDQVEPVKPSQCGIQSFVSGRESATVHLIPFLPTRSSLSEVIGLVEAMGEFEYSLHMSDARRKFYHSASDYTSVLATAELLGLVERRGLRLDLTDLGLGFLRAPWEARERILRSRLSQIEPFKTALEMVYDHKKSSFTAADLAEWLSEKYVSYGRIEESDIAEISSALIEWALSTEMLEYNGKKGKFSKEKR